MRTLVFTALALMAGVLHAELNLVIKGPTESLNGDLVVLSTEGTVAGATNWIIPEALQGKSVIIPGQPGYPQTVFFATRNVGTYTFVLYGTGSECEVLHHVTHTVVITSPGAPPVDPEDPPPVIPGFGSLEDLSFDLSVGLNDPKYRALLGMALMSADFTGSGEEAANSVEGVFMSVLAKKSRSEQDVNWQEGWYSPILDELKMRIDDGTIKTVADYKMAIAAVAKGLQR